MTKTIPVWLRLTEAEIAELDRIARAENRSRAGQLKQIVLMTLKKEEKQ